MTLSEDFAKLNADITAWEEGEDTGANAQNRVFYLAIPPSVFGPSCNSIKTSAMAPTGWTRVIVEKPFGCGPFPTAQRQPLRRVPSLRASSAARPSLPFALC